MQINEIICLPVNTPVDHYTGRITAVRDRYEGQNDNGTWSFQRVETADDNGGTITLLLKDREPFPFHPGSTVRAQAVNGSKGISGLYAHEDNYKGNRTRMVKVTPSATLTLTAGHEAPPEHEDPGVDGPGPSRNHHRPQASDKLTAAKREIVKIVNLHALCVQAVERMEAPLVHAATGSPMSDPQKQAAVASVFIRSERAGLVDMMPSKPFTPEDFS